MSEEIDGLLREIGHKAHAILGSAMAIVWRYANAPEKAIGSVRTATWYAEEAARMARRIEALLEPYALRRLTAERLRRRTAFHSQLGCAPGSCGDHCGRWTMHGPVWRDGEPVA